MNQKGFTKNFLAIMKAKEKECCLDNTFIDGQYNFYVEKRYDGLADLNITPTGITSSNVSYNSQLTDAKVGDPNNPFPSIWAAQEQAKLLAAQDIPSTIIVRTGYIETVGSATLAQNGDTLGSLVINQEPNVKVANDIVSKRTYFSLGQKNINYVFEPDSGVINICKSYAIPLIDIDKRVVTTGDWNARVSDTNVWNTNIYGEGQFKWIYGQGQGFNTLFFQSFGLPKFEMIFEADLIMINQSSNIIYLSEFSNVSFDFDKYYTYEATMSVLPRYNWETAGFTKPIFNLKIRDCRFGQQLFTGLAPSANDWWQFLVMSSLEGMDAIIDIDTFNMTAFSSVGSGMILAITGFATTGLSSSFKNHNVVFNVNKLKHRKLTVGSTGATGLLYAILASNFALGELNTSTNNHFTFNVNQAEVEGALGFGTYMLTGMTNSTYTINVFDYYLNTSLTQPCFSPLMRGNAGATQVHDATNINNQVTLRGKFITNNTKGILDFISVNNFIDTGARINANTIAVKLENATLIQKNVTGPAVGLNLASWNDFLNLSLSNVVLVTGGGNSVQSLDACNVLIQNVQGSTAKDAAVTEVGETITVVPTLAQYNKN